MHRTQTSLTPRLLTASLGLLPVAAPASAPGSELAASSQVSATSQAVKAESVQRSEVMETLSYLSDVYGPRLMGTSGYHEAALWAKQRRESWGVEDVRFESVGDEFRGWTTTDISVDMVSPRYMPLIAYPVAYTRGTSGTVEGVPLIVDDLDSLRAHAGSLRGRIVMRDDQVIAGGTGEPVRFQEALARSAN